MQLFCILVHANICFCSHKLSRLIFWHLPRLLRSLHGNEISELPDGIFNDVASLSHLWVISSYCFNLWDSDEIFTWTPHGKAHSGGQVEQPRSNTGLPVVFFSWLAHVLTPPSISPVVKATHRPLHCLIPLQHLLNTFFMVCGVQSLFIYVFHFRRGVQGRRACTRSKTTQKYLCSLPSCPLLSLDCQRSIELSVAELLRKETGQKTPNKDIL